MDMIAHQAVSPYSNAIMLTGVPNMIQIGKAVRI